MNHIKNKKDLEATIDDIRKYAYSYLEKYSPSKQQLKTYLLKKIIKKVHKISDKRGLMELINEVILTLEDQKFISDKFYSDSKSKSFLEQNKTTSNGFLAVRTSTSISENINPISPDSAAVPWVGKPEGWPLPEPCCTNLMFRLNLKV